MEKQGGKNMAQDSVFFLRTSVGGSGGILPQEIKRKIHSGKHNGLEDLDTPNSSKTSEFTRGERSWSPKSKR